MVIGSALSTSNRIPMRMKGHVYMACITSCLELDTVGSEGDDPCQQAKEDLLKCSRRLSADRVFCQATTSVESGPPGRPRPKEMEDGVRKIQQRLKTKKKYECYLVDEQVVRRVSQRRSVILHQLDIRHRKRPLTPILS